MQEPHHVGAILERQLYVVHEICTHTYDEAANMAFVLSSVAREHENVVAAPVHRLLSISLSICQMH